MGKALDLKGMKFGRLTPIRIVGKRGTSNLWKCKCDCGNTSISSAYSLKSGNSKSCGCYQREVASKRKTHGMSKDRLYRTYKHMKERCLNSHCGSYSKYGERGITVCEEWIKSFESFKNWSYSNGYSEDLTLDRIDGTKGYYPENCRWVDYVIQNNNTSRNHLITYNGETHTIAEWSRIRGIPYNTLNGRIFKGVDIKKALNY